MPDTSQVFLAVDLGASSGRVVAGLFDGTRLALEEVYRFDNGGVHRGGADALGRCLNQWQQRRPRPAGGGRRSMAATSPASASIRGASISASSAATTSCSAIPTTTATAARPACSTRRSPSSPARRFFQATGLQFMEFNTLYQLLAMKLADSPLLDVAESLPDDPRPVPLAAHGRESQRIHRRHDDAVPQSQDRQLGDRPARRSSACRRTCSATIAQPGTKLGKLQPSVAEETDLAERRGDPARHARHGQRRRCRARGQQAGRNGPTGATSAAAPGR